MFEYQFEKKFFPLLIQQYFKFNLIGILATLTHISIFVTLIEIFRLNPYFCNVSAYIFAVFVSFCGNFFWVFKRKDQPDIQIDGYILKIFSRFFVISMIGLLSNTFFVWFFVDFLNTKYLFSVFFMAFITPIFIFYFNKFWVFN